MTAITRKLLAQGLLCLSALSAHAQDRPAGYPGKPIRIMTGTAAGGAPDILVRMVGQKLTERWGGSVIVENVAGGNGVIAAQRTAQAPADGYSYLVGGASLELLSVFKRINFDELAPVVQMTSQPFLLVVPNSLPVRTVKELAAYAKARPGQLNYASAGNGTLPHLTMEMFNSALGVNMVHIPYKGSGSTLPDLIAGRVQVFFISTISGAPQVRSGAIRAIATSSAQRLASMPDLPTVAESGIPDFEANNGFGLFTQSKAAAPIQTAVNREVLRIMHLPEVKEKLAAEGAEAVPPHTPAEYSAQTARRIANWTKVVEATGIKAE